MKEPYGPNEWVNKWTPGLFKRELKKAGRKRKGQKKGITTTIESKPYPSSKRT